MPILRLKPPEGYERSNLEWTVQSLPGRSKVFGNTVRGEFDVSLDVGKYIALCTNIGHVPKGRPKFKTTEEHMVGISEERWNAIKDLRPTTLSPMHTVSRGVLWQCKYLGCEEDFTSQMSAAIHEGWHQGIDLLEEPEKAEVVAHKASKDKNVQRGRRAKETEE